MDEPAELSGNRIDLLLRCLAGQATAAEAEELVRWLAARPEHARTLATLERALAVCSLGAASPPEASSAAAVWDRLAARLPEATVGTDEPRPLTLHRPTAVAATLPSFSPRRARPWLRAAVVLLAAGAAFGWWRVTAAGGGSARTSQVASGDREYVTRPGERASFMLADGTQVMLGVASRLRVPGDYGRTTREVTLDGEAYFEVQHDASRNFLVQSAHGITEDVGTRFDVHDYTSDTATQVVVAEGAVSLRAQPGAAPVRPMVLTAGQLGSATVGGTVTMHHVDVAPYLAWLEGRLVLRDVPLRDALPQLSRWYDLDFRLGDSTLAATGISATLTSQPIAGALDLLAVTLGVRIERQGRTVTLYPQATP